MVGCTTSKTLPIMGMGGANNIHAGGMLNVSELGIFMHEQELGL